MAKPGYLKYGEQEVRHLSTVCPELGKVIDRLGFLERPVEPDLFTALASSIVSQQITGKVAQTIWGRLVMAAEAKKSASNLNISVGAISPETFSLLTIDELRACGLSQRKAEYIYSIALAAVDGTLDFELLKNLSDTDFTKELVKLRGVGEWTAEMMLIFSLERPDVLSWGDFAIKKGITKLFGLETLTREKFEEIRSNFSPYNTVASLYIWEL
ncbi:MAG: DNA-3-methyladenine glycosylase [Bacteroidales bacterium]|jgi:DNA-3-methyladenine glycosylase II|nr:DNA-3-methyladenine glycosylase [Bacteroidales bacterium]